MAISGPEAHGGIVPQSRTITTSTGSLTGGGALSGDLTLTLSGDLASPGASKMYGTNGSGVKGWQSQPSGAGVPADTVTAETTAGASSSAGAATTYSRGDHTHGTPADPVPTHNGLTTVHASATTIGGKAIPAAGFEAAGTASAAVTAHEGAADPHTGYQKETEKGAANGYAGLGAGSLVPAAQLATGTPDGTKYLRDDQTWQAVAGGSVGFALAPVGNTTLPAGNGLTLPLQFEIVDTYTLTIGDGAVFEVT